MSSKNKLVETQVNVGLVEHNLQDYLRDICKEHIQETDRPFVCYVLRLANVPQHIETTLKSLSWTDYSLEQVASNFIYMGHPDGPDHPIPIPWSSDYTQGNPSIQSSQTKHAKT